MALATAVNELSATGVPFALVHESALMGWGLMNIAGDFARRLHSCLHQVATLFAFLVSIRIDLVCTAAMASCGTEQCPGSLVA